MSADEMRKKVKKLIDKADDRAVKMVYSMLEADAEQENDWWNELPESVKKSILKAEKELDEGKGIPHAVVMKKYSKWLTK